MKILFVAIFVSSCSIMCDFPAAHAPTEQTFSVCEIACRNLAQLGCDIAEPDEAGSTCVEVCEWTQEKGLVGLEPEKMAQATSCPD